MELNLACDASIFNDATFSGNVDVNHVSVSAAAQEQATSSGVTPDLCRDKNLYYDMSGDKILIIFNHFTYQKTEFFVDYLPGDRRGTYKDVEALEKTFSSLGFKVETYNDLVYPDIMKQLSEECNKSHESTSCVAVAVLTHGTGACVAAADRWYPLADITDKLHASPGLAKKPKLFFIQACRSGHTHPRPLPKPDKHFFLFYAAYEDFISHRDQVEGTWFIQTLCEVIDTHHATSELQEMATEVKKIMAEKRYFGKQMPVPESNLTKFLVLYNN